MKMPPHRLANMVYSWVLERLPHDQIEDWKQELVDLLPWQDTASEAAVDLESESFMNMMAKG